MQENKPTRVGGLTWMCPRCEYEDDLTVYLGYLDLEFQTLLWNYLKLPEGLRQQVSSLVEELAQLVEDVKAQT